MPPTPAYTQRQASLDSDSAMVKYESASSPNSSLGTIDVLSIRPAVSRATELRLMHHYTTTTSKTLAALHISSSEEAWSMTVPALAFEVPCLLDAVLAVSALHLRALTPQDQSLARASHAYMGSALSKYSSMLREGPNASNAEALFITSCLVAFQASASRLFLEEDADKQDGENGYTLPIPWFHSFQGVKLVVLTTWQWLRNSERVLPIIKSQPAVALDLKPSRPKFFGPILEGMDEQIEGLEEPLKTETRRAYVHSVAYLNWAHEKPERGRILGFPATVSRRFVELIEQQDPRTLVIIACFFALTRACDEAWWLRGTAKREVTGIMTFLPREWWPKMEWAVRVADTEGPLNEEIWGDCWQSEVIPQAEEGFSGDVHSHIDILAKIAPSMSES